MGKMKPGNEMVVVTTHNQIVGVTYEASLVDSKLDAECMCCCNFNW